MPMLLDRVASSVSGKAPKTATVRLTEEAVKWARIASGYTGESMVEYISRIVVETGKRDAERLHSEVVSQPAPKPKRPKGTD